mgnify:CR=1 FL=1
MAATAGDGAAARTQRLEASTVKARFMCDGGCDRFGYDANTVSNLIQSRKRASRILQIIFAARVGLLHRLAKITAKAGG